LKEEFGHCRKCNKKVDIDEEIKASMSRYGFMACGGMAGKIKKELSDKFWIIYM